MWIQRLVSGFNENRVTYEILLELSYIEENSEKMGGEFYDKDREASTRMLTMMSHTSEFDKENINSEQDENQQYAT